MPKRKTKLQQRIDRLTREKYELLRKIKELLKERDNRPNPAPNETQREATRTQSYEAKRKLKVILAQCQGDR